MPLKQIFHHGGNENNPNQKSPSLWHSAGVEELLAMQHFRFIAGSLEELHGRCADMQKECIVTTCEGVERENERVRCRLLDLMNK